MIFEREMIAKKSWIVEGSKNTNIQQYDSGDDLEVEVKIESFARDTEAPCGKGKDETKQLEQCSKIRQEE